MVDLAIPGVKRVRAKSRDYYYHRASGQRLTRPFGTSAFLEEVEALDRATAKPPAPLPGTLGLLVAAYRRSPEWHVLAAETKAGYRRTFDRIEALRDMPLTEIDQPFVLALRDKMFQRHKRRAANYVVQVLRLTLAWGVPRGFVGVNAAKGVPLIRRPRSAAPANRRWTAAEYQAVVAAAPAPLRLAVALGLWAALRVGDIVRLPWSAWDGQHIVWTHTKNGNPVEIEAPAELRALLESTPRQGVTVLLGERGAAYTRDGLQTVWHRLKSRLQREGKVQPGLTLHGLRHTLGSLLAEAGADQRGIGAAIGDRTTAMADLYSRQADQRLSAARALRLLDRPVDRPAGKLSERDGDRDGKPASAKSRRNVG
jgi:integrase